MFRIGGLLVVALFLAAAAVPDQQATAAVPTGPTAPRIAVLYDDGRAEIAYGAVGAGWEPLSEGVASLALSGDRAALLTTDGRFLVGAGTSALVQVASEVAQIAISGDRVGYIGEDGIAMVAEFPVSGEWTSLGSAAQLVMSGRRTGVVQADGTALIKDGDLTAPWVRLSGGVRKLALSGNRIGVVDAAESVSVKEGGVSAPWVRLAYEVKDVVLHARRIGVVHKDGVAEVKEGGLAAGWVRVADEAASLLMEGNRVGVLAGGSLSVKEGALDGPWTHLASGVVSAGIAQRVRKVTEFGALCDGGHDDTAAVQAALDVAQSRDIVTFPAGRTCLHQGRLVVRDKERLTLRGEGTSRLAAADRENSALEIRDSAEIEVQDLGLESPPGGVRSPHPAAAGLVIRDSSGVHVRRISVLHSAQSGVFITGSRDVEVTGSRVERTLADGMHITDGSSNVTLSSNHADHTGDDSFASVTYRGSARGNENIRILDNTSRYSNASGVAVEGSKDVEVERNSVYRSRVAGLRITVTATYDSRGVQGVSFAGNTLTRSPDLRDTDHPAILVYVNHPETITGVAIRDNLINDPESRFGVRVLRLDAGVIENITVQRNVAVVAAARVAGYRCVSVSKGVGKTSVAGNTLNREACRTT